MSFFNTIRLEGVALKEAQRATETQDERILRFFREFSRNAWTPWEVQRLVYSGSQTPITSIRRSINTLTEDGKLIKTGEKRQGPYGKPSYAWRLKPQGQMSLF